MTSYMARGVLASVSPVLLSQHSYDWSLVLAQLASLRGCGQGQFNGAGFHLNVWLGKDLLEGSPGLWVDSASPGCGAEGLIFLLETSSAPQGSPQLVVI